MLVEGELSLNRWEDKDGNKRSKHELLVGRLVLMPKAEGAVDREPREREAEDAAPDYDGVPF